MRENIRQTEKISPLYQSNRMSTQLIVGDDEIYFDADEEIR